MGQPWTDAPAAVAVTGGAGSSGSSYAPQPFGPSLAPSPAPAPVPVGQRKAPRRSRAVMSGALLTLAAVAVLAWSSYTILASINIFEWILGDGGVISGSALAGMALGAVLALVAVIVALVGVVRSSRRLVASLLLVAALVLPAVATAGGLHQGGQVLKSRTLASAAHYAGKVSPEQVDAAYDWMESLGLSAPGREEVVRILREVKDPDGSGGAAPAPQPSAQTTP